MKYYHLVILFFVMAFFLYLISSAPLCEKKEFTENFLTSETNIKYLDVIGNSMFPIIKNNSECLCIKQKNYNIGDIVLYFVKIDDIWTGVVHRIVKIDGEWIYIKGDNNDFIDPPTKKENIDCAIPEDYRYKIMSNKLMNFFKSKFQNVEFFFQ